MTLDHKTQKRQILMLLDCRAPYFCNLYGFALIRRHIHLKGDVRPIDDEAFEWIEM